MTKTGIVMTVILGLYIAVLMCAAPVCIAFYPSLFRPAYILSAFGGFFFLMGLGCIIGEKGADCEKSDVAMGRIVFAIGGIITFTPLIWVHVPEVREIFGTSFIVVLAAWIFASIGVGFFYLYYKSTLYKKSHCTVETDAQVIDHVERWDNQNSYVANVYAYNYGGKTYKVQDEVSSSSDVRPLREIVKICINPENPEEFYKKRSKANRIYLILGLGMIAFGASFLFYI